MSTNNLEQRLAAVEAEVARLKQMVKDGESGKDWRNIVGTFANDPAYEEAMKLGRQWRESFRPKPRRRKKAKRVDRRLTTPTRRRS